jgi:hypothetical protein
MGLFDFAREKLTAVTDALPTDLVDQALSVGEGLTGTDLGGIADAVGQGPGVQDIAVDAASGAVEGTAAAPIVDALGQGQGVQDIAVDAASGAVEGTAAAPIVDALGDVQP